MALFVKLYKMLLAFESVSNIFEGHYSDNSFLADLSYDAFIILKKMAYAFDSVDKVFNNVYLNKS